MLTQVLDGVWMWQALELELKRHLNGYLLQTRVGLVMVDPPSAAEVIVKAIEAIGRPRAIIVTGRSRERRTRQFQGWYDAKVFAPERDARMLRVKADHYYKDGESLPGGFRSVGLEHQRTPGETALYHKGLRLMVAAHLVGQPAGYVQMQEQGLYWNFSRALEAQLRLLEYDYDTLLPGRGAPITKEARIALAKYIAGLSIETNA